MSIIATRHPAAAASARCLGSSAARPQNRTPMGSGGLAARVPDHPVAGAGWLIGRACYVYRVFFFRLAACRLNEYKRAVETTWERWISKYQAATCEADGVW
jgi:hypothetical protein